MLHMLSVPMYLCLSLSHPTLCVSWCVCVNVSHITRRECLCVCVFVRARVRIQSSQLCLCIYKGVRAFSYRKHTRTHAHAPSLPCCCRLLLLSGA